MSIYQMLLVLVVLLGLHLMLTDVQRFSERVGKRIAIWKWRRHRVGIDAKQVIEITPTELVYKQLDGQQGVIHFEACGLSWVAVHSASEQARDVVGDRNVILLYIKFYTEPPTYIYFKNGRTFQEMKMTLRRYGWHTFDLT